MTLVFDRDEQDSIDIGDEDRLIDEHVKDCFRAGQRVLVILLPGPPNEAHHDFVARFEKFTLKRICGDLKSPDVIAHKKGVWPPRVPAEFGACWTN